MPLLEDLEYYQSKRRFPDWQPKASTGRYLGSNRELLRRCMDFLPLELQVAVWDRDMDIPEVNHIIERNAQDETKHDQVLSYLSDYVGKRKQPEAAKVITERWQQLDCHPVVAMYALEMGVFFSILPTLIKEGDVYSSMVAQWISDDERVHVETGLRLMKHLGLKLTKEVIQLVFDTNYYIFSAIDHARAMHQANRAISRLISTKDPEMLRESLPVTVANFEQHSRQQIVY